jgi:translocation and assembly module TamB
MAEDKAAQTPAPPRKKHRGAKVAAIITVGLIGLVVAAPWLLSMPIARDWLVGLVNSVVASGKVHVDEVGLSWMGPLVAKGLVLKEAEGKTVVSVRSLTIDRGLIGLLSDRRDFGTIAVDGAVLDLERRSDGSIDLLEAIRPRAHESEGTPKSSGGPPPAFTLIFQNSSVRISDPGLADPFEASEVDATVKVEAGRPVDLVATLADGAHKLDVRMTGGPVALEGSVVAKDWPVAMRHLGTRVRGRLDGSLTARERDGLWDVRTQAGLSSIVVDGPALAGDRPSLDFVRVNGAIAQTSAGWDIKQFEITSPVGSIRAGGTVPARSSAVTQLEGSIDLAALAKLAPRALRLRDGLRIDRGRVRVHGELVRREGVEHLTAVAEVADLGANEDGREIVLRDPARVEAHALRTAETIKVESLTVRAAGLSATAQGDLDQGVKLTGKIDLREAQAELGELLDLSGIDIAGRGGLAADYRRAGKEFQARLAIEFVDLSVAGMTTTPIDHERVRIDGSVVGNRSGTGLPADWRSAHLALKSADGHVDVVATEQKGTTSISLDVATAVHQPTEGRLEAKVSVRWKGQAGTIEELRLGLVPSNFRAGDETFALALKGRFDLDKGSIELNPLASGPTGAVGLGDSGVKLKGLGGSGTLQADGTLVGDLAALDRLLSGWSRSKTRGLGGTYAARLLVDRQPDQSVTFRSRIDVPQLVISGPYGPVTFLASGTYDPRTDILSLPTIEARSRYAGLGARASVADMSGQRIADVGVRIEPAWEAIDGLLAGALGPDGRVRATVHPFELRGPVAGGTVSEVLSCLEGTISLDLTQAQAYGVTLGQTPIMLRVGGGRAVFDTIQTTINQGTAEIGADLDLDDPNALWLRLAPGTRVDHAQINEVVSTALLAYAAPVLSEASEVDGALRLAIREAAFPLIGNGSTRVLGEVVFENVVFEPGPGASEILALAGQRVPKLALSQPIQLQVADGRVTQSGLKVPINRETQIALAGSVGFDRTLQMKATMPLTGRMLGRDELVQQLLGGTQITVPIGGTLSRPGIDRQALQATLRQAMQQVARKGLEAGAGRILERALNNVAGDAKPALESGSLERDAKKLLENLGREILGPRRP